jgi:predicted RNase H-like HicB family nuclease
MPSASLNEPFGPCLHRTTLRQLPDAYRAGIMSAAMDGPANLRFSSSAVLVHIEGNVPWRWRKGSGGNYVAICDPLKITLQARSYQELTEDIADALDALLKDLLDSNEFDQFMRDHGWTLLAPLPARPKDVKFDLPFSIVPLAMAGADDPQRVVHQ